MSAANAKKILPPPTANQPQAVRTQVQAGRRTWEIRLSPSSVTTIAVLLVVSLAFFFLFGLIVGSGYAPTVAQPELESLVPNLQAELDSSKLNSEGILPPEDLRFMTNLKEQGSTASPLPMPETAVKSSPVPPVPAVKPQPPSTVDSQMYDYMIRAAAFKSEDQADALRAKLEGASLRTKMVTEKAQKGTWYHVQILYRGTAANLQKVLDGLPKYGIKDAIVASKTPL